MCTWVGPHAPIFGRQLWGLPRRVEYLSPQGVLLPLVYGTTASPLWLELRGHSAWQATPFSTVYRFACHRLLPWLRVTFAMVPDAAWPGSDQGPWSTASATGPVRRLGCPSASNPWGVGSFLSLGRPTCVQCPWPLGSCSRVCPRGLLCCVCGVLGHLAPVHRCAGSVCCVACAVSWVTWLPFTSAPAGCVVLRVRCCGPLGSCSPVRPLGVLLCVCGVLGHLAPVHRCPRSVCCVACAVSWATWLLFTGVPARFVVLCLRCPGPLGSCSPVFPCSSLFACLFCFFFFFFSGRRGCGVFGALRGFWCVLVPVLVWPWVSLGTGVGWLSRSGFPVRAPAPRLPVSRASVRGVLTAGGWRLWWRGACAGGRGSWVAPGWRGRARARVWVCSWRGLMGWWAVWAWLVCVDVGYVCAEGAVGWAGALWAMQWVEEMLVTPTGGVL